MKKRIREKDRVSTLHALHKKEQDGWHDWVGPGEGFRDIRAHYHHDLVTQELGLPREDVVSTISRLSYRRALSLSWKRTVKRLMDIAIASLLLLFSAPLFFLIAILIKLDSRGPIFFTQQRIGMNRRRVDRRETESIGNKTTFIFNRRTGDRRVHNLRGKPFKIFKFRTMKMTSPKYDFSPKTHDDERLTRFGRFLRKVSLDELPQLINVIRGDMSLVGPRPEMPYIVVGYNRVHAIRLQMKPGVTGIWQLRASRDKPIHENLIFDLQYIRDWSLWLDCKLLCQTVTWMFHCINV